MNGKYRVVFALIGVFALSVLSGCVGTTAAHDTLVVQIEETVLHLDNRYRSHSSAYDAMVANQYQGYLGMIAPGETIVTLPGMATSFEVNEALDEWTFTLRAGAKFHDGSVIDAKTVRYSMVADYMAYYDYDNMSQAEFEWLDSGYNVSYPAADPNGEGLVVTFSDGYFPDPMFFFDVSGAWNFFTLVPFGVQGSYTDTTAVCQEKMEDFREAPVSCGPYKFKETALQDYVLLERFDDWFGWGQTFAASNGQDFTFPAVEDAFEQVKFRTVKEKAVALAELKTAGVDVTTGRFNSQDELDDIMNTKGFDAYTKEYLGGATLGMNLEGDWPTYWGGLGNFPVSQDWFRKAVSHAINRTNLVDNVYLGIADERDALFPDWILDKFTNIDTSEYYDFDQGIVKAEEMLNASGYDALGFSREPDNRFGFGPYANETSIDGVEQANGRHFVLTTMNCDFCTKRAVAIQKDLAQVGIYVVIELQEFGQYLDTLDSGDAGYDYNTTGPQPDPNFSGGDFDFYVGGFGGHYETPWDFVSYQNFVYWLYYGYGGYDWYNIDYEIAWAKATDGWGYVDYYIAPPDDYPYPVPEWSNDNEQFVQACEDMGYLKTAAMDKIPLVWYVDTYAFNDHLNNFLASRGGDFIVAYSYWACVYTLSPSLFFFFSYQ